MTDKNIIDKVKTYVSNFKDKDSIKEVVVKQTQEWIEIFKLDESDIKLKSKTSKYLELMQDAEKNRNDVINDIKMKINVYKIEGAELGFEGCKPVNKKEGIQKIYRNPEDGSYWIDNGKRGRRPDWIRNAKNPDDFLVEL